MMHKTSVVIVLCMLWAFIGYRVKTLLLEREEITPSFSEEEQLLRDGTKPALPVVIERRTLDDNWAYTMWDQDNFLIVVHDEGPRAVSNQSLIHEWAHVLAQDTNHDDEWGIEFARCYRAVYGDEQ